LILALSFVCRDTPASADSDASELVTVQQFLAYRDGTEDGVGTGMRFSAAGRGDCRLPANQGWFAERLEYSAKPFGGLVEHSVGDG
jgi:hypothetical protein